MRPTPRLMPLVLLPLLLWASCGAREARQSGDVFRLGIDTPGYDPRANPYLATSGNEAMVNAQVYSTLFFPEAEYELKPDLAEEWKTNPAQTEWEIRLRGGVRFHDGSPLTARDVAYSFNAVRQNPDYPDHELMASVASVEAADDRLLRIRLSRTDAFFWHALALTYVVREGALERLASENPVGTGPFRFDAYRPDSGVVRLASNPRYHHGQPLLAALELQALPNYMEGLSRLMTGRLDCLHLADPTYEDLFVQNPNFKVVIQQNSLAYVLPFNFNNPAFHDPGLRSALNYLAPKSAFLESSGLLEGLVEPLYSFDWNSEHKSLSFGEDLERARAAVGTAPASLKISARSEDEVGRSVVYHLTREYRKMGIELKPSIKGLNDFIADNFVKADFDLAVWPISVEYPVYYLYTYWHSNMRHLNGFPPATRAAMEEILARMRYAPTAEARQGAFNELEGLFREDPPFIFLFRRHVPLVVHRRFRGYSENPRDFMRTEIRNLWVPKEEQLNP